MKRLTEQVAMRLTPAELKMLDKMAERGGHLSRGGLARKIIRDVLDDDARAHGEPGLPRE